MIFIQYLNVLSILKYKYCKIGLDMVKYVNKIVFLTIVQNQKYTMSKIRDREDNNNRKDK